MKQNADSKEEVAQQQSEPRKIDAVKKTDFALPIIISLALLFLSLIIPELVMNISTNDVFGGNRTLLTVRKAPIWEGAGWHFSIIQWFKSAIKFDLPIIIAVFFSFYYLNKWKKINFLITSAVFLTLVVILKPYEIPSQETLEDVLEGVSHWAIVQRTWGGIIIVSVLVGVLIGKTR